MIVSVVITVNKATVPTAVIVGSVQKFIVSVIMTVMMSVSNFANRSESAMMITRGSVAVAGSPLHHTAVAGPAVMTSE